VNAERRMSISSYLVLRCRISRPSSASPEEPVWRRWYVLWLTASLVLGGLIVGAIAALEILTAPPRAPLTPPRPPAHAEEQVSDVELIPGER